MTSKDEIQVNAVLYEYIRKRSMKWMWALREQRYDRYNSSEDTFLRTTQQRKRDRTT